MTALLKTVGYGFLIIILSPFIVLGLAIFAVYAIVVYLFLEVSSLLLFFTGKSFKNDDMETIKLKEIMKKEEIYRQNMMSQPTNPVPQYGNNFPPQNNNYYPSQGANNNYQQQQQNQENLNQSSLFDETKKDGDKNE
ncbi:MAG: hypothetical protein PHD50_01135 [Bacilli bacterium]|nr:hypothetical protein [Bacilli bacterium]